MAVGKECLGLTESFEEMKRRAYRKSTIKPPAGGGGHIYVKPIWGGAQWRRGGGLFNIWEGAGGLVNLETTMVSVFHKIKLEYKVETLKY